MKVPFEIRQETLYRRPDQTSKELMIYLSEEIERRFLQCQLSEMLPCLREATNDNVLLTVEFPFSFSQTLEDEVQRIVTQSSDTDNFIGAVFSSERILLGERYLVQILFDRNGILQMRSMHFRRVEDPDLPERLGTTKIINVDDLYKGDKG